jgi:hypothetical protein
MIFILETDGGKMKTLKSTACFLLLVLCVCGVSHASIATPTTSATVTYTADNMVLGWWLIAPSQAAQAPPPTLALGSNRSDWQLADSYTLSDLEAGKQYQIVWEVRNLWSQQYPPGGNNPAGFLAQIAFGGQPPILSSGSWEFAPYENYQSGAPFSSLSWSGVQPYGANSDNSTVWFSTNGGPISGIGGNAQWIWSGNNIWDQHGFVRTTFTAPVPLPAAAWMLGAGLVGLITIRRRRQG